MKNEKLHEAFGLIKDEYIEHAHACEKKKTARNFWDMLKSWNMKHALQIAGVAVCAVAIVIIIPNIAGSSKAADKAYTDENYISDYDNYYDQSTPVLYGGGISLMTADGASTAVQIKSETESADVSSQKLIVEGTLKLRVDDVDVSSSDISTLVNEYNGYFTEINDYTDSYGTSSTHYFKATIRVPYDRFDEFAGKIKELGNVISYSEESDDITAEYTDYTARLEVLKAEKERVMTYFDRSQSVSELIEVEERLSELQQEIESIEAILENYDTLTDYSTLYLTLSNTSYAQTVSLSFSERLAESFKDGWDSFTSALGELVLSIVFNIWWLIILGVIAVIVVAKIRKKNGSSKKNRKDNFPETDKKEEDKN